MRKRTLIGLVVAAMLALPTAVSAHGGSPETSTDVFKDVTESFADINPCAGNAPGTVTLTYNGVIHVTQFPDGHHHVTGTFTGTFVFDTTDPALPDYSGRFTQWFGENLNPDGFNATFTFRVKGAGTDGSSLRFNAVAHITIVGSDVIVEFEKLRCG